MHVAAGIEYDWGVRALLDANADPYIKDKMNRSVVPLEKAMKQAIDEDDAQQLYEVLQQHAKMGRIELESIIDKVYDGLRGRSCLDRYRRHKPSCVCEHF